MPDPLDALTAASLMTPGPPSVRDDATIPDALRLLTEKGLSGAMVVHADGQPAGVLTSTDLLIHCRQRLGQPEAAAQPARVRELMTPVIFSVRPDATGRAVVQQMIALGVHRLYVQDGAEVVGVISALDVLRKLV